MFSGVKMRRKEQIQEYWFKIAEYYVISVSRLHGSNAVDPDGHPMSTAKFVEKMIFDRLLGPDGKPDVIGWIYESKSGKMLKVFDDLYQAPKDKWDIILNSGW